MKLIEDLLLGAVIEKLSDKYDTVANPLSLVWSVIFQMSDHFWHIFCEFGKIVQIS